MLTKICSKCKLEKPIDDFHKSKKGLYNRYNICKICKNSLKRSDSYKEKTRLYKQSEKGKQVNKEWTIRKKELLLIASAKHRAKKYGLDFNIDSSDIIIPEVCPVLGIPIFRNNPQCKDNSPSLDRIDNSKGYVKGNVCVISFRANQLKNCGTLEEHKKIIQYMESRLSPSTSQTPLSSP